MLSEKEVLKFIKVNNLKNEFNIYFIGVIMPRFTTYLLGPLYSNLSTKYYLIIYNKDNFLAVGIDNLNGKLNNEAIIKFEPMEISIEKRLFYHTLKLSLGEGTVSFRVNNKMYGLKWHMENFIKLKKTIL